MGFADRLAQRLGGGGQRQATPEELDTELEAEEKRKRDALIAREQGAVGFRSLSDPTLDAATHPGTNMRVAPGDTAGKAQWSSTPLESAADTAYGAAEGIVNGVGVNADLFPQHTQDRLQLAHERSPYLSGGANFAGQVGVQMAGGLAAKTLGAPAAIVERAAPAVGGALSGAGSTRGDVQDKLRGAVVGGVTGELVGRATGKLSSLLNRGAAKADARALDEGLMHSGATEADLARYDELGGRQKFAEGAKRLGLTGRASKVAERAPVIDAQAAAHRQALEQAAGADSLFVDPAAVRGGIQQAAGRYPGVTPIQNAAGRAAGDVDAIATPQGVPWRDLDAQKVYWGQKANFASGTPENTLRQGVHGAMNQELGDALTLKLPGAGDAWRQRGIDQQVAQELGSVAKKATGRAGNQAFTKADAVAMGIGGALGSAAGLGPGTAGGALAALAAKSAYGANKHLLAQGGAKLSALTQRGVAAAAPAMGAVGSGKIGAKISDPGRDPGQAALDVLYSPSQGQELGTYKADFARAAASPDKHAVQALVNRLMATDEQFRTEVLPRLRGNAY